MSQDKFYINGIECEDMKQLKNLNWSCKLNEVELILTPDRKMFHAKRLMEQLCDRRKLDNNKTCTKTPSDWLKHEKATKIKLKHPEWFNCIKNSWFFSLNLLHEYALSCNPFASLWLAGDKDWNENNDSGYIYLIQRGKHLNTNIYKVGKTWNLKQRFVAYGKDVKILRTYFVTDQTESEKLLINNFNNKFEHAICDEEKNGKEYFLCPNDTEAIITFDETIKEILNPNDELEDEI